MSDSENYDNTFQDSSLTSIGGKILAAAIIAVFVSVVFVILLHLYTRWTWRRYAARDRSGRGRGLVFAPDSAPALINRGLEPSVIQSIPIVVFSPKQFKDGLECAVCLSELSDGDKARLLPKCNHGFHVECIDMWFQSHSTCPLCRSPVLPEAANPQIQLPESIPESPINFPTNVLFWGSQHQISTRREEGTSSSDKSERDGMLVIEIPTRFTESFSSPSFRLPEGESSSPTLARLRSLKRLLSRGTRDVPYSPHGGDLEQGIGGAVAVPSPKTTSNS